MPCRCPIATLGLYLAYQFLTLKEELPKLDDWLDSMHKRPLIRQQRGGAAAVTDFNPKLKEELALIGADTSFTFHCIRDQRIAEAGERGDDPATIHAGAGHSTGAHDKSYRATNSSWTLGGSGYSRDPEEHAAHVKALYTGLESGAVDALVTKLYEEWRPEILQLQRASDDDESKAGERMRTWLHTVRTVCKCCMPD